MRLLLIRFVTGHIYKLDKPPATSIAAQSWLNYIEPVGLYLNTLHFGDKTEAELSNENWPRLKRIRLVT